MQVDLRPTPRQKASGRCLRSPCKALDALTLGFWARTSPIGKALGAELASRARPAAIAPIVAEPPFAAIAGMVLLDDEVDESSAAERVRVRPGLRLGSPHQRGLDGEGRLGAEPDRLAERT